MKIDFNFRKKKILKNPFEKTRGRKSAFTFLLFSSNQRNGFFSARLRNLSTISGLKITNSFFEKKRRQNEIGNVFLERVLI